MQDGLIIRRIGMMSVRVPVAGAKVNLDVADRDLVRGFLAVVETGRDAGEIRPAGMVPKSGLNDFYLAAIVRGQNRLIKLLEP